MEFHGWLDGTIAYEGGDRRGSETPPILDWVQDWAKWDGCAPSQSHITQLCGKQKPVTRYAWNCKSMEDAVVHYNISNLHHDWPSKDGNSETDNNTCFDATKLIMEFFGKHSL